MFDIIKQPLPFYDSLEKQQVNASGFISTQNIFLMSPNDRYIPFQIYRPTAVTNLTVNLVKKTGLVSTSTTVITSTITLDKKIIVIGTVEYDYYRYFGNDALSSNNLEGDYYIHITDGTLNWYSEWFSIHSTYSDNLVKYEFWNTRDIYADAYYLFQDDFKFRIWIPGFIKYNSEHEIFERIVSSFNNERIKPYQKKAKLYSLIASINSFMGDALEISEICDNIWVTNQQSETKQITIVDLKMDEVPDSDIMELNLKFKAGFVERGNTDANAAIKQVFLTDITDEEAYITDGDTYLTD
jgi:hypothetical protein